MDKPNPASVFGRRQQQLNPEVAPATAEEASAVVPERTENIVDKGDDESGMSVRAMDDDYAEQAAFVLEAVERGDIQSVIGSIEPNRWAGVARVSYYNPEKGFGFATIDGVKVFIGQRDGQKPYTGYHSVPDLHTPRSNIESPVHLQAGDSILVQDVAMPYRDTRRGKKGNNKNTVENKKDPSPSATGWVPAREYMSAVKSIYEREPQKPGIYFDGNSKNFKMIDGPWSLPHAVQKTGGMLGFGENEFYCTDNPGTIEGGLAYPSPYRSEMIKLAEAHGLTGGIDEFRAYIKDTLNTYVQSITSINETHDKLAQINVVGDESICLGGDDVTLKLTDGVVQVSYDTATMRYGMDDEEDVYPYTFPVSVGGIKRDDVDRSIWDVLEHFGTDVRLSGEPLTADRVAMLLDEWRDRRVANFDRDATNVSTSADKILEHGTPSAPACLKFARRMMGGPSNWKQEWSELRQSWSREDAAADAKKARALEEKRAAELKILAAEQQSRESKAGGLGERLESIDARLAMLRESNPDVYYSDLRVGDSYFVFQGQKKLYTERNVLEVEGHVLYWEKALQEQRRRAELRPSFELFADRLNAIGYRIEFTKEYVKILDAQNQLIRTFSYDDEIVDFENTVSELEAEAAKVYEARQRALEEARLDAEGAAAGLPNNIEIGLRERGATRRRNGWVILAGGSLRDADELPRSGQDGLKIWKQVRPGELVLQWRKESVISDHEFNVIHMPEGGVTEAQLAAAAQILDEIAKDWSVYDHRKDDPRGDMSSPPVGKGWDLEPADPEIKKRQHAILEELRGLGLRNEALYESTKLAGLEGASDDITSAIGTIQAELDTLLDLIDGNKACVERGDLAVEDSLSEIDERMQQIQLEIKDVVNRLEAERAKRRMGGGESVSDDALKALTDKFNTGIRK